MPRTLVGLLAAAGAAASALAGLAHGPFMGVALGSTAAIAAVLAYLTAPSKKTLFDVHGVPVEECHRVNIVPARQSL